MTDKLRQAAQQALESLVELVPDPQIDFGPAHEGAKQRRKKSIAALRAALAQQPAEPVAWIDPKHLEWLSQSPDNMTGAGLAARKPKNSDLVPLYTHAPDNTDQLAAAVLRERERCAKVCEEVSETYRGTEWGKQAEAIGDAIAAAIRGETK